MKVRVSTNEYQAVHAMSPRGPGLWVFQVGETRYMHTGSYTAAKKAAVANARYVGVDEVVVLP